MITIKYKFSAESMEICFSGHANHGYKGTDIICAGVSAIYYALLLSVEQSDERAIIDDESCFIKSSLNRCLPFFEMALRGLRELEKVYPSFVRVVENDSQ